MKIQESHVILFAAKEVEDTGGPFGELGGAEFREPSVRAQIVAAECSAVKVTVMSESLTSSSDPQTSGRLPWGARRLVWISLSLLVFVASTIAAWLQPLPPPPSDYGDAQSTFSQSFLKPIERNAFARLPKIEGDLNAVFALPGSELVWAVGDAGLIIHSDDGGRTWKDQTPDVTVFAKKPVPATVGTGAQAAGAGGPSVGAGGQAVGAESPSVRGGAQGAKPAADPPKEKVKSEVNRLPDQPHFAMAMLRGRAPDTVFLTTGLGSIRAEPKPLNSQKSIKLLADKTKPTPTPSTRANERDPNNSPFPPEKGKPTPTSTPSPTSIPPPPGEYTPTPTSTPPLVTVKPTPTATPPPRKGIFTPTPTPPAENQESAPSHRSPLRAVYFSNASLGWAVGDKGTILSTSDGGKTWSPQTSVNSNNLTSVYFVNQNSGWAVGDRGTILSTNDGGQNWNSETSGTEEPLNSIHFVDVNRGWVVGGDGTILSTSDGGKNWSPQVSATDGRRLFVGRLLSVYFVDANSGWAGGPLHTILSTRDGGRTWYQHDVELVDSISSLHFIDANSGWAIASEGTIISTHDGGKNWKVQAAFPRYFFHSVRFADANRGWAVGSKGTIFSTRDGGRAWDPQTLVDEGNLNSIHFVGVNLGWAVGTKGTIFSTSDGGKSWNRQASGIEDTLTSVYFANSDLGWVVGGRGTILSTRNGGKHWELQSSGTKYRLNSVHFVDTKVGWTVSEFGEAITTSNGGESWVRQPEGEGEPLTSVQMLDSNSGWVSGTRGTLRFTHDGGSTWAAPDSKLIWPARQFDVRSIHFIDRDSGWAVGGSEPMPDAPAGTILRITDAGKTIESQNSGVRRPLNSVYFTDSSHGWTVGSSGTILSTIDGGKNWIPQIVATNANLNSLQFVNPNFGCVVGDASTILLTHDSGKTWTSPTHRRYPAPWYYAALTLCLVLLAPTLRSKVDTPPPKESVADRGVTDAPIEHGAQDQLGFARVAHGLSRFLRNEKTEPPLTIAITGQWGMGKSSLMNLVKEDLLGHGFYPVWFNAWHHTSEEGMLAGLMESIREQGLPSPITPPGILFRIRLLDLRGRRRWLSIAVSLVLFFTMFLVFMHYENLFPALIPKNNPFLDTVKKIAPGSAGLAAALALVWSIVNGLSAFRRASVGLLPWMSGRLTTGELQSRLGFRHQFARDFEDITKALGSRRMTIVIDDLDRCDQERLVDTLKTINFLSSSGKCFFLLGLAKERIIDAIGLHYKDLAEAVEEESPALKIPPPTAEGVQAHHDTKQEKFARKFLEKLLNLEVTIPKMRDEQASELMGKSEDDPPASAWIAYLESAPRIVHAVAPWLFILGLVAGLTFAVSQLRGDKGKFTLQANQTPTPTLTPIFSPTPTPTPIPGSTLTPTPTPTPAPLPPPTEFNGPRVIAGSEGKTSNYFWIIPFVAFSLVAGWRLSLRPNAITKDSPEFRKAWAIWSRVLAVDPDYGTPRATKRFINRVRFRAMSQRPDTLDLTLWEKLMQRLKKSPGAVPSQGPELKEALLVVLSVIYTLDEQWLKGEGCFQNGDFVFATKGQVMREKVRIAEAEHKKATLTWPPTPGDRDLFLTMIEHEPEDNL